MIYAGCIRALRREIPVLLQGCSVVLMPLSERLNKLSMRYIVIESSERSDC